jgi:uncharacterized protein YggE
MLRFDKTASCITTGSGGWQRLHAGYSGRPRGLNTLLRSTATVFVTVLVVMFLAGCSDSPRATVVASGTVGAVSSSDTITVVGEATIKSAPDEAVLTVAVESDGKDPAAAMNTNSATVSTVVERIKREGVAEDGIETANVSVYAIRTYTNSGQEKLSGYRATNSVVVTLKDVKKVGKVLSAAVEAGGNNVSGPVWQLSDDAKAVAEALSKAAQNARQKAKVLADSLGVGLGDVVMMSENSVQVPVYPVYGDSYVAKDSAGAVSETPVSAASLDVTAAVTVTFVLKR